MIGRLVHTADFERVLASPARCRSAHFAVHHMATTPTDPQTRSPRPLAPELSTELSSDRAKPVDKLPLARWLGCVVPKRLARRAVTRNLLKRQIRVAAQRHEAGMPAGLWVVRLRAPFEPARFPSARSAALMQAAGLELEQLLGRAVA
jgi:ribonuclease P protein component